MTDHIEIRNDETKVLVAAITISVVGVAFFMAMPAVVSAWSIHAGLSEQQAGLLASFDSGGGIVASLLVSLIIRRVNWRVLACIGIAIGAIANIGSAYAESFHMLSITRIMAGFGSGIIYALGLGILATTNQAARNFSILLFAQVSFGMIEINAIHTVVNHSGMNGIYFSMEAVFFSSIIVVAWLPRVAATKVAINESVIDEVEERSNPLGWICLIAVFLFYIASSSFWAYIELIGRQGGVPESTITASLTYTQMLSLFGCVLAGWISVRMALFRPLILSLGCAAVAIYSLSLGMTALTFVLALSVFFLVWNAIDIFQLGTLAIMDNSGRFTAMVPAFQMTAIAIGPAFAALIFQLNNEFTTVLVSAAICIVASILCYLYVGFKYR
jgi:predicted MFS family arabinose efflux permease